MQIFAFHFLRFVQIVFDKTKKKILTRLKKDRVNDAWDDLHYGHQFVEVFFLHVQKTLGEIAQKLILDRLACCANKKYHKFCWPTAIIACIFTHDLLSSSELAGKCQDLVKLGWSHLLQQIAADKGPSSLFLISIFHVFRYTRILHCC